MQPSWRLLSIFVTWWLTRRTVRFCLKQTQLTTGCIAYQVVDYKEKKNWKFMQKYWHKGAYYQTGADDQFQDKESDDIFRRDFSSPTGEDKFDKTILPKVMQVCHSLSCDMLALTS